MYNKIEVENEFGVIEFIYISSVENYNLILDSYLNKGWEIVDVEYNVNEIPPSYTEYNINGVKVYM